MADTGRTVLPNVSTTRSCLCYASDQLLPQPQTATHHQRQRHPHHPALNAHFDFISLHMHQILLVLPNRLLMQRWTMATGFVKPVSQCTTTKPIGCDNRRWRAPIRQQGDDYGKHSFLVLEMGIGHHDVLAESCPTAFAVTALVFLTMDADASILAQCTVFRTQLILRRHLEQFVMAYS